MVSWRRGGASIISSVNILFLWLLVLTFLAALEGIILFFCGSTLRCRSDDDDVSCRVKFVCDAALVPLGDSG